MRQAHSEWRVAKAASGGLRLQAEGIPAPLFLRCPVWTNGHARHIPLRRVRKTGTGWLASGLLRLKEGVWRVEDRLIQRENTLVVDRRWTWQGGRLGSARLGFDLCVPVRRPDFWAMPYISLNGNRGARSGPTGLTRDGKPWIFREERTTAPGLMTIEARGVVAGSYTDPGRSERTLSASCIIQEGGGHTLRTFYPGYEAPCSFLGTGGYTGGANASGPGLYAGAGGWPTGFVIDGAARFRRRFYVVLAPVAERRHGYVHVWESAWRNLREPIAPPVRVKLVERLLWRSLDPFWVRKGEVRGFSLRVDRNGHPLGSFSPVLSLGWCAPTMMLAWLAIRRAIRSGRTAPAERAIEAAEFFIRNAPLGKGVFRTHYDLKSMRWCDGGLDAVQMGGAAYWILRCAELLNRTSLFRRRIDASQWADFALRFCDLAVRTQADTGAFAARWTADGRCAGTERAMGVHAVRATLEACRRTGERRYLQAAERGAAFYIRHMIDRESGYGDCTDLLDSTTENDAAGVPDFLIELYRETGRARYLAKAVRTAEYSLAYMFAYNVHFPPETECGRRGMRTRGSAAISPETAFISFFFAPQANAFLELWKETGERRWKDYAVAVVRGTLQMMTEPGDTFGLAPHLLACRAEVLPVLDTLKGAHVWKQGMTGYSWHQPVWWPAAFNLLNFAVLEDRFQDVIKDVERP